MDSVGWKLIPEKPRQSRLFWILLFTWNVASAGAGPARLRAEEVLARALGRESLERIIAGSVGSAEADVLIARRWKNPVFSYTFEQASGRGSGASEGIYFLQQQFEPGRRRRLRQKAAEARVDGAGERGNMLRIDVEASVLETFYEVLAAQRRAEAGEKWAERLEGVAKIVELRNRAGDASGYDLIRVAREKATVRATIAAAQADAESFFGRLRGMMGRQDPDDARTEVEGELLPAMPPGFLGDLLLRIEVRPDILALREAERAATYEERVARGWKIPSFTLGAGYKDVREGAGDLDGPVAYAAIPLPILNRQEGPAKKATAKRQQASGSLELLIQEARGAVRGAYSKERRLGSVAARFRADAVEPAEELLRTAEAAYRAGELGILSLLDAYRTSFEGQARFLELAKEARRARIELNRLTGGLEQ